MFLTVERKVMNKIAQDRAPNEDFLVEEGRKDATLRVGEA
jgi:hypothetical protein